MSDVQQNRLQALREQTRKGLQFLISYLLANAESTLASRGNKSGSNAEQAQNYEALRELRLKGAGLEKTFLAKALEAFDRIGEPVAAPAPRAVTGPGAPSSELRIDGLGVLKESILEEQLALEAIASRARHQHRDSLIRLGQHVARESGQRRVELDALPIGPQALASAFMDSCSQLKVEPGVRVVFSRLFTRFIIDELGPFYAECLALFPEDEAQAAPVQPAPRLAAAVRELPTGQQEDDGPVQGAAIASPESIWDSSRTPLLAPPGKAMAMPRNLVDDVLEGLQERLLDATLPLAAPHARAGIQPLDVIQLLNDSLAEMGQTRAMALPADVLECVGLVRMLFEHTLRDARVPAAVRRVQRLLQVPVLRAALRDADVLNSADHPVRALVREIGSAASGPTASDAAVDDDLLRLIKLLVTRILSDYEKDVAVFRAALDDLRRYLRARDGGGAAAEEEAQAQAPQPAAPRQPAPAAPSPSRTAKAPERASASPEFVQLVDKMAPDTWVELKEAGGARRRIKLFSRISRTGQMQFVDDAGARVGEYGSNELASMIEQGDAKILHGSGGGAPAPGRFGRR